MAKNEVTALVVEGGLLRAVRYAPRGRDAWVRTGGGFWPVMEEEAEPGAPAAEGDAVSAGTVVESDRPLTRAFCAARSALGERQVVLALPLSRLLVRVIKLPVEMRDELADAVTLQMDKLSPFAGEELSVGYEVVSETETDLWVLAAALPETVFGEIGVALETAGLQVVRTDMSAMGWFRSLCGPCGLMRPGRRVVLMDPDSGWDLFVVDHGVPVQVRGLGAVPDADTLVRELTLSLLNAELDAGSCPIQEVLVVSREAPSAALMTRLGALAGATARHVVLPSEDAGAEGVAMRTGEEASLDLTPQSWRDSVGEARIRRRVLAGVGLAASVWLIGMGVLLAGPLVYKQLTARVNKASRAHFKAYKAVADTRERVNLIQTYTDRTCSSLEMLRLVSSCLPQGITLVGFNYRRDDGVRVSGEADQPTLVYEFKNAVTEDPLFESVGLSGPSASKGKHKFEVDAKFKGVTRK